MIEGIGVAASLLVLVSFLFEKQETVRKINIFGALLFVFYGLLIDAFSVWFLNGVLILIHLFYLLRGDKYDGIDYSDK